MKKTVLDRLLCPTTEIGSLPHPNVDSALEHAFQTSIPFLPQLPARYPQEYMIAQALDEFPGATPDNQGVVRVDPLEWKNKAHEYGSKLDRALKQNSLLFEPQVQNFHAWKGFLFELEERKTPFAKIQLAGPLTCQWSIQMTSEVPALEKQEILSQIFQTVFSRIRAMIRTLRNKGTEVLVFLDEPGLAVLSLQDPQHRVGLQELKILIQMLKKEDALIGLHCCSNTHWGQILSLPLDVLSIDLGFSFSQLCEHPVALQRFLQSGGRLALGVIPTGRSHEAVSFLNAKTFFETFRTTLEKKLPSLQSPLRHQILTSSLYTPACGLALHSPADADRILNCLLEFQKRVLEDAQKTVSEVPLTH